MGKNVVDVLSKDPGSKLGMEMTNFEELTPRRVLQGSYDLEKEPSGALDSFRGEDKQLPIDYAANPIGTAMGNDAMQIGRMGGRIMAGYGAGVGLGAATSGAGTGASGTTGGESFTGGLTPGADSGATLGSGTGSSVPASGLRYAGSEEVLGQSAATGAGTAQAPGGLQVTQGAMNAFNAGTNLPYAVQTGAFSGGAGGQTFNAPSSQVQVGPNAAKELGTAPTPAAAPQAPGSPAPATAPAAAGGQQSVVQQILAQMKANAVPLGIMGLALAGANRQTPMPTQQQMEGLSSEAQQTAQQLMSQYRSGQLSAGQAASLDQLTRQTKNQITQYFSSIGQADSTAHQQALAQVDQQALAMKQQMLDSMLQQGLQAIGVAAGPLNSIAQYQMGQDAALRQAYGNFATGAGLMVGRNAGTPSAPQPQAPQQPSQVSSVRTPAIPESQNLG